jgi:hypothetical protein
MRQRNRKPRRGYGFDKKRTDRCKNPTDCGGKLACAPSPIELGPPPQALSCRRRRSPGGHRFHSTLTRYRYSRPPRALPILLGFPLHRWRVRVLAFQPMRRAPRTVARIPLLEIIPSSPILQACANTSEPSVSSMCALKRRPGAQQACERSLAHRQLPT